MNSLQRVMTTIQGGKTDRVPVLAVLGAYGGTLTGTDLKTLYSDAEAWVAGQRAVQETFGIDMILATFDFSAIAEVFGGQVAWFANQAPNMKRPGLADAASALKAPIPDPRRAGRLPVILAAVKRLAEEYRERAPLFAAVPGPCSLPPLLIGIEKWMETLLFDGPMATALLAHSGRFFLDWTHALLEAGVTGFVIPEAFAPAEVTPRELFSGRLLGHVRDMFSKVGGPLVFHHGGGSIGHILDLLPGMPGMIGVGIGPRDSLGTARKILGPDLLLLGNLNNLSFPDVNADEIKARSLACLREAAPGGRYILCHAGADIPISTPPENIHAMLQASHEYEAGRAGEG